MFLLESGDIIWKGAKCDYVCISQCIYFLIIIGIFHNIPISRVECVRLFPYIDHYFNIFSNSPVSRSEYVMLLYSWRTFQLSIIGTIFTCLWSQGGTFNFCLLTYHLIYVLFQLNSLKLNSFLKRFFSLPQELVSDPFHCGYQLHQLWAGET